MISAKMVRLHATMACYTFFERSWLDFPKRIRIVNGRIRIPFFQSILDIRISVDGYLGISDVEEIAIKQK